MLRARWFGADVLRRSRSGTSVLVQRTVMPGLTLCNTGSASVTVSGVAFCPPPTRTDLTATRPSGIERYVFDPGQGEPSLPAFPVVLAPDAVLGPFMLEAVLSFDAPVVGFRDLPWVTVMVDGLAQVLPIEHRIQPAVNMRSVKAGQPVPVKDIGA